MAHQLGAATINSFDYTYDKVGNRKTKADRNGSASYTYDTLNRLTEAINPLPSNPLESFQYDAVGNRVDSNQNGASIFNVANQLEEDANFRYSYDANGNQIRKTNKTTGELTQDVEDILLELDGSNNIVARYTHGPGVDEPLIMEKAGAGNIRGSGLRYCYFNVSRDTNPHGSEASDSFSWSVLSRHQSWKPQAGDLSR